MLNYEQIGKHLVKAQAPSTGRILHFAHQIANEAIKALQSTCCPKAATARAFKQSFMLPCRLSQGVIKTVLILKPTQAAQTPNVPVSSLPTGQ